MKLKNVVRGGEGRKPGWSLSPCYPYQIISILAVLMLLGRDLVFSWTISSQQRLNSILFTYTSETTNTSTKIQKITLELEEIAQSNDSRYRYYIYESSNLTLPVIRQKAFDPSAQPGFWGQQRWTERFKSYAQGELRFHQALEKHELRTDNISEAAFILVPIPLGAAIWWGDKIDVDNAFAHLFDNEPYFRSHPEKHVFLTNNERLFRSDRDNFNHFADMFGFTWDRIHRMDRATLVNDEDVPLFRYHVQSAEQQSDWSAPSPPLFQHSWSIGYSHEASIPTYPFDMVNFDSWSNKTLHFFYHSITGTSMFNSTIYRHALIRETSSSNEYNNNTSNNNITSSQKQLLKQPSSVGFQIPFEQWIRNFANSKFCLTIRGDNPSSRSFFTSIRLGCLPVIVSDALPYYHPVFRSMLQYRDFAVVIPEQEFLENPAPAVNRACTTDLSEEELRSKIEGLALVQRLFVLDHPASLFVPAFARETVACQQQSYTDFGDDIPF